MKFSVTYGNVVLEDLHTIVSYLAPRNEQAARRFIASAFAAMHGLSEMPERGSPKRFRRHGGSPIRSWGVPGFRKYVIYFVVERDEVIILAVLHGARDVRKILRDR
ncbi:MAG TPA: type II toxin-antitoxin system RelE/ParE family toxin [Tepidisphaeraceae bacterium]|nr:type II toxin-antitoxin system RelE/ParE family toxin [Tepidisphaeraceae bacterium]